MVRGQLHVPTHQPELISHFPSVTWLALFQTLLFYRYSSPYKHHNFPGCGVTLTSRALVFSGIFKLAQESDETYVRPQSLQWKLKDTKIKPIGRSTIKIQSQWPEIIPWTLKRIFINETINSVVRRPFFIKQPPKLRGLQRTLEVQLPVKFRLVNLFTGFANNGVPFSLPSHFIEQL